MFSKALWSSLAVLALTSSVHAHAVIFPELGVKGTPARSDVQRPSAAKPCGTTNIASTINTSTPVAASANGSFALAALNFNAGTDGSRHITTVQVDPTGTGQEFVSAQMLVNGDASPTNVGQQALVGQLPAGTKCSGGKAGNICVVSLTTDGGFGNCVAVQQGAAKAARDVATDSAVVTAANVTATTATKEHKKGGKKAHKGHKGKKSDKKAGAAASSASAGAAATTVPASVGALNARAATATVTNATAAAATKEHKKHKKGGKKSHKGHKKGKKTADASSSAPVVATPVPVAATAGPVQARIWGSRRSVPVAAPSSATAAVAGTKEHRKHKKGGKKVHKH
ncbi:hypothetical protein BV25DRAFT_1915424 [Artomyces pyxidatus]|uniref:Uncharacterized protein n=1 Tax=Artomyces pyxidatus TaxID=48021 RepID=A0ACB8T2Z8_9AGAM|nr:hypothetical protein BV25DRAFT_1915424 [Artomyces pyxidatus]